MTLPEVLGAVVVVAVGAAAPVLVILSLRHGIRAQARSADLAARRRMRIGAMLGALAVVAAGAAVAIGPGAVVVLGVLAMAGLVAVTVVRVVSGLRGRP